jgi:hypothetical protein
MLNAGKSVRFFKRSLSKESLSFYFRRADIFIIVPKKRPCALEIYPEGAQFEGFDKPENANRNNLS